MPRLQPEERGRLLDDLAHMGSQGRAERESVDTFKKTFYPVPEHSRAFDPDVVLIIGERGSGKSELFRAVVNEGLLPAIIRAAVSSRLAKLDPGHIDWLAGHPLDKDFPDHAGLRRFLSDHAADSEAVIALWFAYLVRVLGNKVSRDRFGSPTFFDLPGGDVGTIVTTFRRLENVPLLALDELDKKLERQDHWVFVSYDELDILGAYDWNAMARCIEGLVSFWANYSRRWSRIRAKIFLRTDLFRRHAQVLGADLIRLAANRAEIFWSDRNLYAMLVKRIANTSEELRQYCEVAGLRLEPDQLLGLEPKLDRAEDARPLIERMVGAYMGADIKKGRTLAWLLSHVRDGNGRAMPRALVRLIEEGARQEQNKPRATYNRLLDPRSLRRALDEVSKEHVLEVNTHELPWLPGVADRLQGEGVPMPRRSAERLLGHRWDDNWGKGPKIRPPVETPYALVDYLVEIGVFRVRTKGKLDVPDLFLAGLGLTRKGGVKK
jgi:energy-coupling factor transporter ATP-binding protein EcfA2